MKNTEYIIILITCSSKKEADKISKTLLSKKLVACVNIINGIQSFFFWKNKIDSAKELLLLAKTKKSMYKKVVKLVESLHSYEVPEIIALPIIHGNKKYLNWIDKSL